MAVASASDFGGDDVTKSASFSGKATLGLQKKQRSKDFQQQQEEEDSSRLSPSELASSTISRASHGSNKLLPSIDLDEEIEMFRKNQSQKNDQTLIATADEHLKGLRSASYNRCGDCCSIN